MNRGETEKSEKYKQLEYHLASYVPDPITFNFNKRIHDFNTVMRQAMIPDNQFDVYQFGSDKSKAYYMLRESYQDIDSDRYSLKGFDADPRTAEVKLVALFRKLNVYAEKTLNLKDPVYAKKEFDLIFEEWFSFLEGALSPPFLELLFPTCCEYKTEYTKLNLDGRSYCQP
jgi:hypothetical protein